jgi:hypothetical protein
MALLEHGRALGLKAGGLPYRHLGGWRTFAYPSQSRNDGAIRADEDRRPGSFRSATFAHGSAIRENVLGEKFELNVGKRQSAQSPLITVSPEV